MRICFGSPFYRFNHPPPVQCARNSDNGARFASSVAECWVSASSCSLRVLVIVGIKINHQTFVHVADAVACISQPPRRRVPLSVRRRRNITIAICKSSLFVDSIFFFFFLRGITPVLRLFRRSSVGLPPSTSPRLLDGRF